MGFIHYCYVGQSILAQTKEQTLLIRKWLATLGAISFFCRTGLEYTYFIIFTDAVRLITGPMNAKYCFIKTIWRSSYATSTFLCYDAIALTKYLFIFHLKNPAAFKEDFWAVFVNVWIKGASLIFNATWFYQAEHQIINFYICSGIDPTEDFKKPLNLYATAELGSLLINFLVFVRVQIYNLRYKEKPKASESTRLKKLFISDDMKNSIASLATNFFNISGLILILLGSAILSKVPVQELHKYKSDIYCVYLIYPPLAFAVFLSSYYISHNPLRNAAVIQLRDFISYVKEFFLTVKNNNE